MEEIFKVAKIILINPKKEMLLYLRDDKPFIAYPNHWDFVGGGVESGESYLKTIRREMKEELGFEIKNITLEGKILVPKNDLFKQKKNELSLFKGGIDVSLENINFTEGTKILGYFNFNEFKKLKIAYFYKDFITKNKKKLGI